MKQKILLLLLALATGLPAMAQHWHEISVNGGYGTASLPYSLGSLEQKTSWGGRVGVGYNFFFAPQWSVKTGIDLGFYSTKATLEHTTATYNTSTPNNVGNLQFTYTYTGYEEAPSVALLTIPVMLQFETTGNTAFYAALGAKIGIPAIARYKTTGQLNTRGYNLDLQVPIDDNLPEYGFGNFDIDRTTDLDLNVAVQLAVEAGAKWRLTEKLGLYGGIYFDYGLNNLNKNTGAAASRLITYQPENPGEFVYGGLFKAGDKFYPVSVGITVRLSFGLGGL
jgi:hypothetical protein